LLADTSNTWAPSAVHIRGEGLGRALVYLRGEEAALASQERTGPSQSEASVVPLGQAHRGCHAAFEATCEFLEQAQRK